MRGGVAACVTRQSRRHQLSLTLVFPWQVLRDVSSNTPGLAKSGCLEPVYQGD